jgi:hypothetical protein
MADSWHWPLQDVVGGFGYGSPPTAPDRAGDFRSFELQHVNSRQIGKRF